MNVLTKSIWDEFETKSEYVALPSVHIGGLSRLPPNLNALRYPVITYTTTVDTSKVTPTTTSFALAELPVPDPTVYNLYVNQPASNKTSNIDNFYAGVTPAESADSLQNVVYASIVAPSTSPNLGIKSSVIQYDGASKTVFLDPTNPLTAPPINGDVVYLRIPTIWYHNDNEETWLAVSGDHVVITTRQDKFGEPNSIGFDAAIIMYSKDKGNSFQQSNAVLGRIQGATTAGAYNDFTAVSNLKCAVDNEGRFYLSSVSFNSPNYLNGNTLIQNDFSEAVNMSTSTSGGENWSPLFPTAFDPIAAHYFDSPTIYGDPFREHTAYMLVADDLNIYYGGNSNVFIQITKDGGSNWTDPYVTQPIVLNPADYLTTPYLSSWAPDMVTINDDKLTLLVATTTFAYAFGISAQVNNIIVSKSTDGGDKWIQQTISSSTNLAINNPDNSNETIDAFYTNQLASSHKKSKRAYVVYVTNNGSVYPTGVNGIAIQMTKDSGSTWKAPVAANPNGSSYQSFLGSVAVADNGTVAVFFYDNRNFVSGSGTWYTDAWITLWTKKLKFIKEIRLTPKSFDLRLSILRFGNGRFYLGDFQRIRASGNDFFCVYSVVNSTYQKQPITPSAPVDQEYVEDDTPRNKVMFTRLEYQSEC